MRYVTILTAVLIWPLWAGAQDGEALFKGNCASCHKLDAKLTGPALRGVHERWQNKTEEMVAFIHNSQAYMKAGRPLSAYAQKLYQEYNQTVMPAQALSDDEIKSILTYIKDAPTAAKADIAGGPGAGAPQGSSALDDRSAFYILATIAGLLLIFGLVLIVLIAIASSAIKAHQRGEKLTWSVINANVTGFFKSPFVTTMLVLVVLGGVGNAGYKFLWSLNLHDGYKPVQPIAFSHALHAGQYKIACQYCHTGVEKSKNATIPSTNICMNCHNVIEEGPKYGKKEIAKVRESYNTGKPIEWVKVHNLPDLVYFNHAQHVKVAGLECAECHGKVEEMEEVYQHARLSMGWCINCHREKEVDINKDGYYKSIHASLRADMEAGKVGKITVEKLGGLECARCHY
jgi:cytochrome c551/c552